MELVGGRWRGTATTTNLRETTLDTRVNVKEYSAWLTHETQGMCKTCLMAGAPSKSLALT